MSGRAGVAIVTGASRGIGRAIARAVAEAGYDVAVNYRDREGDARAVVEEIARAGGRARAFRADVGEREAGHALVRAALEAFGQVDVLVNNAGIHLPGVKLADVAPEAWARILQVNLSGPLHLIQAVLPHMRARGAGRIVNLSSNVTQRMPATYGPYTVS